MARIIFSDFREPAAAEAYDIALDYLLRAGAVRDEFEAYVFLADALMAMVDKGHANKIRMANQAIAEYENYLAEPDSREPESDYPLRIGLEQVVSVAVPRKCR
jgi:hypothetical protein